ncbi:MAG: ubiquinol-cytochrome C chaperone family protein [Pseudomonadota bacterium]
MLKSFFRKDPSLDAGDALFAAAAEQARALPFYETLGVPDTIEGRFELVALHVWLVLRRLKEEAGAKDVSQRVFDAMFASFDAALRETGVGDLVVGKKIRKLAENFYGRVAAYNDALGGEDGALEGALARNVYESTDPAVAGRLADYVRRTVAALAAQPGGRIAGGVAKFPEATPA